MCMGGWSKRWNCSKPNNELIKDKNIKQMTRFVPLSDVIPNGKDAIFITNRKDIDANKDTVIAQDQTSERHYSISWIAEPESLKKGYTLYYLSEIESTY